MKFIWPGTLVRGALGRSCGENFGSLVCDPESEGRDLLDKFRLAVAKNSHKSLSTKPDEVVSMLRHAEGRRRLWRTEANAASLTQGVRNV